MAIVTNYITSRLSHLIKLESSDAFLTGLTVLTPSLSAPIVIYSTITYTINPSTQEHSSDANPFSHQRQDKIICEGPTADAAAREGPSPAAPPPTTHRGPDPTARIAEG